MIQVDLTGADGSHWDLRSGPVRMVGEAAEGFGFPKLTRPTRATPGRSGQRRTNRKSTAAAREGFLPVDLIARDEDDYFELSARWWRAWDPDVPGTLTVTRPSGDARTLQVYLSDDDNYAPEQDPTVSLGERVSVTWVADDPWWRGPLVSRKLGVGGDAADFLNGGTALPIRLTSSNAVGKDVLLSNPGDEPALPTIRVANDAAAYSVVIGGAAVAGRVRVPVGGALTIDSAAQSAILRTAEGLVSNITPLLDSADFRPIAPGGSVPISTSLTGGAGATLAVEFAPLYRRAW